MQMQLPHVSSHIIVVQSSSYTRSLTALCHSLRAALMRASIHSAAAAAYTAATSALLGDRGQKDRRSTVVAVAARSRDGSAAAFRSTSTARIQYQATSNTPRYAVPPTSSRQVSAGDHCQPYAIKPPCWPADDRQQL